MKKGITPSAAYALPSFSRSLKKVCYLLNERQKPL